MQKQAAVCVLSPPQCLLVGGVEVLGLRAGGFCSQIPLLGCGPLDLRLPGAPIPPLRMTVHQTDHRWLCPSGCFWRVDFVLLVLSLGDWNEV